MYSTSKYAGEMWRQGEHAECLIAEGLVISQLILQNGGVILRTGFKRHDSSRLNGFWNGKNASTTRFYSQVFMLCSPHTPNDLTFHVAILLTSFLMILSNVVPARRSGLETILSPENLVPDGFITLQNAATVTQSALSHAHKESSKDTCEKWRSITYSQGAKEYPTRNK